MLADGGYQMGELAKCFYPHGVEISSPHNAEAEAQTLVRRMQAFQDNSAHFQIKNQVYFDSFKSLLAYENFF